MPAASSMIPRPPKTPYRKLSPDSMPSGFPDLPGELPDPPVPSAEAEYISHWDRLNRIHMLAELDETDRRLLTAFSLEGKTTKEIAGEMNMTDGQVRVRLHRIRRRIRKGMKDDA